jgi:hypothetical protein
VPHIHKDFGPPLVVAGDFNNNPRWDKPNGPNNMELIARELMKRGLVSLYHRTEGLEFGAEQRETYWQYRNREMPYHIDYIFVPMTWFESMVSFDIGNFEEWCGIQRPRPAGSGIQIYRNSQGCRPVAKNPEGENMWSQVIRRA